MKSKRLGIVLLLVFVISLFSVMAAEEDSSESSCDGFWGSVSCFLWGNPDNRAGKAWWDRSNLVGQGGDTFDCTDYPDADGCKAPEPVVPEDDAGPEAPAFDGNINANGWNCKDYVCTCSVSEGSLCRGKTDSALYYPGQTLTLSKSDSTPPTFKSPVKPDPDEPKDVPPGGTDNPLLVSGKTVSTGKPVLGETGLRCNGAYCTCTKDSCGIYGGAIAKGDTVSIKNTAFSSKSNGWICDSSTCTCTTTTCSYGSGESTQLGWTLPLNSKNGAFYNFKSASGGVKISNGWSCNSNLCTCKASSCSGHSLAAKEGDTVSVNDAGFVKYKSWVCQGNSCTCTASSCPFMDGAGSKGDTVDGVKYGIIIPGKPAAEDDKDGAPKSKNPTPAKDDSPGKATIDEKGVITAGNVKYTPVKDAKGPGGEVVYSNSVKDDNEHFVYNPKDGTFRLVQKESDGKWVYVKRVTNGGKVTYEKVDSIEKAGKSKRIGKGNKYEVDPTKGPTKAATPKALDGKSTDAAKDAMNELYLGLSPELQNEIETFIGKDPQAIELKEDDPVLKQLGLKDVKYAGKGSAGGVIIVGDEVYFYKGTATDGKIDLTKSKVVYAPEGYQVMSQTLAQKEKGEVNLGDKRQGLGTFTVGKEGYDTLKKGEPVVIKEDDGDDIEFVVSIDKTTSIVTNADDETQRVYDAKTKEMFDSYGDFYEKDESGFDSKDCGVATGCYKPIAGKIIKGGKVIALTNYDYKGTGAKRELEEIKTYQPGTGLYSGSFIDTSGDGKPDTQYRLFNDEGKRLPSDTMVRVNPDGSKVTLVKSEGVWKEKRERHKVTPGGKAIVTAKDGTEFLVDKDGLVYSTEDPDTALPINPGNLDQAVIDAGKESARPRFVGQHRIVGDKAVVSLSGPVYLVDSEGKVYDAQGNPMTFKEGEGPSDEEIASARSAAQNRDKATTFTASIDNNAENFYESKGWQGLQLGVQSIYAITDSVKSYPGIGKLMEEAGVEGWNNWLFDADQTFAPMLGSNWFPSAICEAKYDIEPEGSAMIKTVSGTYQAVATIQAERSEGVSPILCQRSVEGEFFCEKGQVCVDNSLCYADNNGDGEPDLESDINDDGVPDPLEGYFYKITWGVTAPSDESHTLYIDENGVAVSFNVVIDTLNDDTPNGDAKRLYNLGGSTVAPIKLENGEADRDVIVKYSVNEYNEVCIDWFQPPQTFKGQFTGSKDISDICSEIKISNAGQIEWEGAGKDAQSTTVSGEEAVVTPNTNW